MAKKDKNTAAATANENAVATETSTETKPEIETSSNSKTSFAEQSAGDGKTQFASISIRLTPDGKIDATRMRGEKLKRAKQILSDPENMRSLGIGQGDEQPILIDSGTVNLLLDGVEIAEQIVARPILKLDEQETKHFFTYSPEFRAQIIPPAQRVLSKHAPDWMLQYQDEFALAGLFAMDLAQKVEAIKKYQAEKFARQQQVNGHDKSVEQSPRPL